MENISPSNGDNHDDHGNDAELVVKVGFAVSVFVIFKSFSGDINTPQESLVFASATLWFVVAAGFGALMKISDLVSNNELELSKSKRFTSYLATIGLFVLIAMIAPGGGTYTAAKLLYYDIYRGNVDPKEDKLAALAIAFAIVVGAQMEEASNQPLMKAAILIVSWNTAVHKYHKGRKDNLWWRLRIDMIILTGVLSIYSLRYSGLFVITFGEHVGYFSAKEAARFSAWYKPDPNEPKLYNLASLQSSVGAYLLQSVESQRKKLGVRPIALGQFDFVWEFIAMYRGYFGKTMRNKSLGM